MKECGIQVREKGVKKKETKKSVEVVRHLDEGVVTCDCCGKSMPSNPDWFVVSHLEKDEHIDQFLCTPCDSYKDATVFANSLRVKGAKTNIVDAKTLRKAQEQSDNKKMLSVLGLT